MQTVLTALIFRYKQVVSQVYCQKETSAKLLLYFSFLKYFLYLYRMKQKLSSPSFADLFLTRVRDKISMQTVLTALIFRHKQVEPQVYCQKSNRLLEQNIDS